MKIKKSLILSLLFATALTASGQSFEVNTTQQVRVHLKDGGVRTFDTDQIDSLSFFLKRDTTWLDGPALSISVPTDFSDNAVKRVMHQGKKVAEVCQEYIRSIDDVRVVVYPCDASGKADLLHGFSATDGGTVVFDNDTLDAYTAGNATAQLATVYLVNGRITAEAPASAETTTVEPDYLNDVRSGEELLYSTVKIGRQYWMAENLATEYYLDGTLIPYFKSTQVAAWNTATEGGNHYYADDDDFLMLYGRLYNGYAVLSEKGLAPEGWQVPTIEQWAQLRKYARAAATRYKSSEPFSWGVDGEGNNKTGFTALPGGYFSSATNGDAEEGADAYFWSQTKYYDSLMRENTLNTFRINIKATNTLVYSTSGHAYTFGHSVRCVRK